MARPVLGRFLFALNHHPRYPLEIGAHPGHEFGIVAWPVAWDERGEKSGSHVQRLKVVFCLGVLAIPKYIHE